MTDTLTEGRGLRPVETFTNASHAFFEQHNHV